MPHCGSRPAFYKAARGIPLTKADCVVERRAAGDHGAWRLEIGTCIQQPSSASTSSLLAGRWSGVSWWGSRTGRVNVCACRDERGDRPADIGEMTGPIDGGANEWVGKRFS